MVSAAVADFLGAPLSSTTTFREYSLAASKSSADLTFTCPVLASIVNGTVAGSSVYVSTSFAS